MWVKINWNTWYYFDPQLFNQLLTRSETMTDVVTTSDNEESVDMDELSKTEAEEDSDVDEVEDTTEDDEIVEEVNEPEED